MDVELGEGVRLGRLPVGRPERGARHVLPERRAEGARRAPPEERVGRVLPDEDGARADVRVDEAHLVGGRERVRERLPEGQDLLDREPLLVEQPVEPLAGHGLEDDVGPILVLSLLDHARDGRVDDLLEALVDLLDPFERLGRDRLELSAEGPDGDGLSLGVLGLVDGADPAARELLLEPVAGDLALDLVVCGAHPAQRLSRPGPASHGTRGS